MHHTDGPTYVDRVGIISLGTPAVLSFRPKLSAQDIGISAAGDVAEVLLQPRSLLVFGKDAYRDYMHGITAHSFDCIGEYAPCLNKAQATVSDGDMVSYYISENINM